MELEGVAKAIDCGDKVAVGVQRETSAAGHWLLLEWLARRRLCPKAPRAPALGYVRLLVPASAPTCRALCDDGKGSA